MAGQNSHSCPALRSYPVSFAFGLCVKLFFPLAEIKFRTFNVLPAKKSNFLEVQSQIEKGIMTCQKRHTDTHVKMVEK